MQCGYLNLQVCAGTECVSAVDEERSLKGIQTNLHESLANMRQNRYDSFFGDILLFTFLMIVCKILRGKN